MWASSPTLQKIVRLSLFVLLIAISATAIVFAVHEQILDPTQNEGQIFNLIVIATLIILFVLIVELRVLNGLRVGSLSFAIHKLGELKFERYMPDPLPTADEELGESKPKQLPEQEKQDRERYATNHSDQLPGQDVPSFNALLPAVSSDILVRPSAYPMTPMYLLDNNYRILDWNDAFSLAFDRTMEGRHGRGILEWTYFLDNYKEVLDHAMDTFRDPDQLPSVDKENIVYTSLRYGPLRAVKRAYRIPDDNGDCLAWLITLDLNFSDGEQHARFQQDLIHSLGNDQLWSEYAISYDKVLKNTEIYWQQLNALIGPDSKGELRRIEDDASVLDLGAGTGNLSALLMNQGQSKRQVIAIENNRVMLDFLRGNCAQFLTDDSEKPGVIAVKQDASSLFGLDDDSLDYVVANNVLYSMSDPHACLEEVLRVLKPGGELRLTGPRKDTKLNVVFDRIRKDLKAAGKFEALKGDFEHIQKLHHFRLKPLLDRWSTDEMVALLKKVGFSEIVHRSEEIYNGQSMLVAARK